MLPFRRVLAGWEKQSIDTIRDQARIFGRSESALRDCDVVELCVGIRKPSVGFEPRQHFSCRSNCICALGGVTLGRDDAQRNAARANATAIQTVEWTYRESDYF